MARSNQARSNLTKGTSTGLCSEVLFGNWADVLIGEWGSVEIMPNPYDPTMYKQGGVQLRILQSVDVAKLSEILQEAWGEPLSKQTFTEKAAQAGKMLRRLGFSGRRKRIGGKQGVFWKKEPGKY